MHAQNNSQSSTGLEKTKRLQPLCDDALDGKPLPEFPGPLPAHR
jgi:hypothetical protein